MKKLKETKELERLDASARKRQKSDEEATRSIEAQIEDQRILIDAAEAERAQRKKMGATS